MTPDQMKTQILENMMEGVEALGTQVQALRAMDNLAGSSGRGDLMDQLTSLTKALSDFESATLRGLKVVPSAWPLKTGPVKVGE